MHLVGHISRPTRSTNIWSSFVGTAAEPQAHTTKGWSMPAKQVQFRERSVRRIIRAALKEGLVAKSATITPDGTITVSLAEPSDREVSLDVSRELDDATNEWDKAYGKDAP
jgi:hypothetical protein